MQRAGTYKTALINDGVFTPDNLSAAVKAKGGERALSRGDALLQDVATKADELFGDLAPSSNKLSRDLHTIGALGGAAIMDGGVTASAVGAGMVLPREWARRSMLGDYEAQQVLSDLLRRSPVTAGNVGASLTAAVEAE